MSAEAQACKLAILSAAEAGESPEALVERLHVKYGGAMDKDAMLAGARYAHRHFENRRSRLMETTGGLSMPPWSVSVALNTADWRLHG